MCRAGLVLLDFIFGCRVSSGHPSHCRPSLVLLDLFLLLSPLQVVTHLSADLSWCCWTSSSAVPFFGGHPSHCRPNRCCLTFFFDCILFRLSPIQVPSWPRSPDFFFGCAIFLRSPIPLPAERGAAGLHLRLSRFLAVTHPTADRDRCCLTFSFDCLLFR